MLTALVLAANLATVTLEPTDDVWVYPYASDQVTDPYLRVWGSQGESLGEPDPGMTVSYSLVKFDLGKVNKDGKLKSAVLVLTNFDKVGYTAQESKDAPVEVREVEPGFTERLWDFRDAEKFAPEAKEAVLGSGYATQVVEGQPTVITVDLMKGPGSFPALLDKCMASKDKALALALTSKLDPEGSDQTRLYKFYSHSAPKPEQRPKLVLTFSN